MSAYVGADIDMAQNPPGGRVNLHRGLLGIFAFQRWKPPEYLDHFFI
jgi:hypothetical protein